VREGIVGTDELDHLLLLQVLGCHVLVCVAAAEGVEAAETHGYGVCFRVLEEEETEVVEVDR